VQFVRERGPFAARAVAAAVRRLDPADARHWLALLLQSPPDLRAAIHGVGAAGEPALVPALVAVMEDPALARVAGEAFTRITGVALREHGLSAPPPRDFRAGPTDDPDDPDVAMDRDRGLPWPDPAAVSAWWRTAQAQFRAGTRHLLGRPVTSEWTRHVLRFGTQRQRAAAAEELALQRPGPVFEVRAPASRQQDLLAGT
jgi:uncharacterized protein (TIGR02270 family)